MHEADIFHITVYFQPELEKNVDTHRHSCMSSQSLKLGRLAPAQALEEGQERPLSPSSPLAGTPETEKGRERKREREREILTFLPLSF